MRKLCIGIAAAAALLFAASPVWALSVSLDLPVSYHFDDGGNADSVSGFKLGVGLPLLPLVGVGLGYENYEAKLKDQGTESKAAFQLYDLFLEIPFPFLNVTLGAGWGSQEVKIDAANIDEKGDVFQYFISLGYPILPLIDLHIGYHDVNAEKLDATFLGTPVEIDASGQMWSLGVRVGF